MSCDSRGSDEGDDDRVHRLCKGKTIYSLWGGMLTRGRRRR